MTTAKRLQKAITLLLTLRCVQIIGNIFATNHIYTCMNFLKPCMKIFCRKSSAFLLSLSEVYIFGVFLVCISPHSDWIRTRKTSNTDNFHALFGKLESKNLQVELKQIQMQTRGKYLASLYNQSALSENVFHLNGTGTRILQVFGANRNLEKTSIFFLRNEVPHKVVSHCFYFLKKLSKFFLKLKGKSHWENLAFL